MAAERFELRIDESLLDRVDAWRGEQTDLPTRAEAVRRLLEVALARSSKESVKFSDGEKILLLMVGEIYKHLEVNGESDPDFISEVIFGGHFWAPRWRMPGVFHDHADNPANLRLVGNVMEMWSFIEEGYERLSKKDREWLEKEADPFGKNPKFRGFDGNNESELMGIAQFLVEKMDRFSRFKKRDLNAHMPTIEGYERMLKVFEPLRNTLVGHGLSATQLAQILNARRYAGK